jgi:hypothetical protein
VTHLGEVDEEGKETSVLLDEGETTIDSSWDGPLVQVG